MTYGYIRVSGTKKPDKRKLGKLLEVVKTGSTIKASGTKPNVIR